MLNDPLVAELLEKRLVGVFATLEPDGGIHAVAIWYALDGEDVVLATGSRSRKVANLARESRASLTLHDSRPGAESSPISGSSSAAPAMASAMRMATASPAAAIVSWARWA